MAKIKVGVFGGGRGYSMIRQLLNNPDAELVAVCDKYKPLLDRVRAKADELGVKIALYEKFDDFFQHDMDAVVMANYANEHAKFAIPLLESGRHILSEVLTCATPDEAVRLVETVEKSGKVYSYAENYCYTPVRQEMRRRYLNGDIGELLYAEGEYIHDCSSIWPEITYGERYHWRNTMYSTFYNTHSLGPILKMTKLRPVSVVGFQTQPSKHMVELGARFGSGGVEMVTLENGALVKSLHGDIKTANHSRFYLSGMLGGLLDKNNKDRIITTYTEGPNQNCNGLSEEYECKHTVEAAGATGHGGGDFYTTYFWIRAILGDEEAKEMTIDVYDALDMCLPGIYAYKSILNGNISYRIPNLRNKEEREALRGDVFPYIENGCIPNPIKDEDIPDEVYKRVEQLWKEGKRG
jgi:predicted dehydrogenase